jgi:hypothetical protein
MSCFQRNSESSELSASKVTTAINKGRKWQSRDPEGMKGLEAQVALDMGKYNEVGRLEAELPQSISQPGFSVFAAELRYRSERESLVDSIRAAFKSRKALYPTTQESNKWHPLSLSTWGYPKT